MGGSTTTNTQGSSQSINEIPQWVQNAGQQNYGLAQQVASQPLQQYQGQMEPGGYGFLQLPVSMSYWTDTEFACTLALLLMGA